MLDIIKRELIDVNPDSIKKAILLLEHGYDITGFVMRNGRGETAHIDAGQITWPYDEKLDRRKNDTNY